MASLRKIIASLNNIKMKPKLIGALMFALIVPLIVVSTFSIWKFRDVMITQDGAEVQATISAFRNTLLVIDLVIVIIGALVAVGIASSITKPIKKLTGAARAIAKGDLSQQVDVTQRDEIGQLADAFREVGDALRAKAEAAEQIAQGNLAIDVPMASEKDTLGNAMATMKDSISAMATGVNELVEAMLAGRLDVRADATRFGGDYARIVQGINDALDAVIGPLNVAVEYMDCISKGDIPEKITDEFQGDFNEIKNNFNQCIDAINGLVAETGMLTEAALEGKLDTRGDASKFGGAYARIVQGINDTLDVVIGPLNVMAEYVGRISQGDIPEPITDEFQGDFNEIKNNLNQCIDAINGLLGETNGLIQAVIQGRFDARGDASRFQGAWSELITNLNYLLKSAIAPLNVAAEYVDRISKGDIPEPITDEYQGDFNEIKDNLNQ